MSNVSENRNIVLTFTVILVLVVPLVIFSLVMFTGAQLLSLPDAAIYSAVGSLLIGFWFYIASTQITEEQVLTLGKINFPSGLDLVILCIPVTIFLGTKQVINKYLG